MKYLIRYTGYEQFCAGQDVSSCAPMAEKLAKYQVYSVLDYANEHATSVIDYDHNAAVVLETIEAAENNKAFPFAVVKPSAIGSFELYQKIGAGHKLTASEQLIWTAMQQRFDKLANAAAQATVVLMIDAEESWIQDGVDLLVLPLIVKYNCDKVVLALTIQLYLKDRNLVYKSLLKDADDKGYVLGVKLVRGAYMENERIRASALNLIAPVCETKDATDMQYRNALQNAMQAVDKHFCIVATHNQSDINWVVDYCSKNNISLGNTNLWFSQLYGMRDYISFSIAKQGANVFKYVPFGPLEQAVPYLIRRALENSAMKSQTLQECLMLKKELRLRKLNG
ncbi:MAG: proline dehydrogenase [Flavobacteriaceae bacterium]|nr:proline dehydrogenase [Flavobacteriaceae bacterium]|tara:strand:- start:25 stop:1041 length:1017 start_codon:yes stop_codon:yes gene_type:complete